MEFVLSERERFLIALRLSPLPCPTTEERTRVDRLWEAFHLEVIDDVMRGEPDRNWREADFSAEVSSYNPLMGDLRTLIDMLTPNPNRPAMLHNYLRRVAGIVIKAELVLRAEKPEKA